MEKQGTANGTQCYFDDTLQQDRYLQRGAVKPNGQTYNTIAQIFEPFAQISDEMTQICNDIAQTHEESAK